MWHEWGEEIRILTVKPDGRRPLGRPRHGWLDTNKVAVREIRWCNMDWIDLTQDRDTMKGSCVHGNDLRVP
jgi:hypothetical protein